MKKLRYREVIADAGRMVGRLIKVVKLHEWHEGRCLWCGRSEDNGHSPTCRLDAAIRPFERRRR